MASLSFLASVIEKQLQGQNTDCPYCGGKNTVFVARKKIFLQLRKCLTCCLMFRYPKETAEDSWKFYQSSYQESWVTALPLVEDLPRHKANNFADVAADFSGPIGFLKQHGAGGRLLDYGASWGYGVHQFAAAGFDAFGYEISRPRAEYGRKNLGVQISSSSEELADASFDVVFSSHVLEHIPDSKVPFRDMKRLLKPGGILMILVPNGDGLLARSMGPKWGPLISQKHVLALTAEFFDKNLPDYGFDVAFCSEANISFPLSGPAAFATKPNLDGEELMVFARRI